MKHQKKHYNILILEDEPFIQQSIKDIVKRLGYNVSGVAESYDEAIESINQIFPHVALCDINILGHQDGTEVAKALAKVNNLAIVYLTTSTDKNLIAKNTFENSPTSYMHKMSLNDASLDVALHLAIQNLESKTNKEVIITDNKLDIWNRGMYYRININDILYIKAQNNDSLIVTNEEILEVNQKLGAILGGLDSHTIKRIHRSYAINIKQIKAFDKGPTQVILDYNKLASNLKPDVAKYINVGDAYRQAFKDSLGLE